MKSEAEEGRKIWDGNMVKMRIWTTAEGREGEGQGRQRGVGKERDNRSEIGRGNGTEIVTRTRGIYREGLRIHTK